MTYLIRLSSFTLLIISLLLIMIIILPHLASFVSVAISVIINNEIIILKLILAPLVLIHVYVLEDSVFFCSL